MNNLEIFKNDEFGEIKTLNFDSEIYFIGKDVANILGYQNGSRDINRHVDEEDRRIIPLYDGSQNRDTMIINESGLYSLILGSKLPNAKKFKKWVTSEVLPSLRKNGSYKLPTNPFETLKLMFDVVDNHEQKLEVIDKKITDIEENSLLNPGEYNLINTKVSERIRIIKRERGLSNVTKEQNGALFKAINSDIKAITGVKTRSQLRQKHLDMVLEFVRDWEPSQATMVIVNQLSFNLDGQKC